MIVRRLMVRTTVTETTAMLDDVTVVRVMHVGEGKLVLRGSGEMVDGKSEDLVNSEEDGRKLVHAHDHMQLIFDQDIADMQDVMTENGHGSMLSSAGALG